MLCAMFVTDGLQLVSCWMKPVLVDVIVPLVMVKLCYFHFIAFWMSYYVFHG